MHEVDRGVYYDRYVYYDMGMLAWHAAVRRYPRLAIGRVCLCAEWGERRLAVLLDKPRAT